MNWTKEELKKQIDSREAERSRLTARMNLYDDMIEELDAKDDELIEELIALEAEYKATPEEIELEVCFNGMVYLTDEESNFHQNFRCSQGQGIELENLINNAQDGDKFILTKKR